MSTNLTILPDPRFQELRAGLHDRLRQVADSVEPHNFSSLLDPMMREVIARGFDEAQAHEGTIWLLDPARTHLVPAYNTGPNADKFVQKFRQPLSAGIVCMVFANEQPFVENDVRRNARQSKLLDELLQVQTSALMVVPFYFLQACRGVVSCVQLESAATPARSAPGFEPAHLTTLERTAALLTRLLEYRLLSETVSWGG